ncbi:hypothetical protein AB0F71_23790 [Kitasatospora sp. NPDC028055]
MPVSEGSREKRADAGTGVPVGLDMVKTPDGEVGDGGQVTRPV